MLLLGIRRLCRCRFMSRPCSLFAYLQSIQLGCGSAPHGARAAFLHPSHSGALGLFARCSRGKRRCKLPACISCRTRGRLPLGSHPGVRLQAAGTAARAQGEMRRRPCVGAPQHSSRARSPSQPMQRGGASLCPGLCCPLLSCGQHWL